MLVVGGLLTWAGCGDTARPAPLPPRPSGSDAGTHPDPVPQPTADVTAPTVRLEASSGRVTQVETLVLRALAEDAVGVVHVELWRGGTKLGEDSAAVYEHRLALTRADNGQLRFKARAYDAAGNVAESAELVLEVSIPELAPAVTLKASSSLVQPKGTLWLTAEPRAGLELAQVEFLEGDGVLAGVSAAPYMHGVALDGAADGARVFRARAHAQGGAVSESEPVEVQVDGTPPVATLAASSAAVTSEGLLRLSAEATDAGGLYRVEFWEDGHHLRGTDGEWPYRLDLPISAADNGTRRYTAVAYDRAGNRATSAEVAVVVGIGASTAALTLTSSTRQVMQVGDLRLTAASTGTLVLARVEFFEGEARLGEDTAAPFVLPVDVTAAQNGGHIYRAVGYDAEDHAYEAAPVAVNVLIRGTPDREGLPNLMVRRDLLEGSVTFGQEFFQPGCELEEYGVTPGAHPVLRFTTGIGNTGDADLFIGDPLAHWEAGDGLFEYSPCHNHFHMRSFMEYALVSVSTGQVWRAAKRSYCLMDTDPLPGYPPVTGKGTYGYCGSPTEVGFHGISVGWSDVYTGNLPGQYLLLDGGDGQPPILPGEYRLRITANPPFTPAGGEPCRVPAGEGLCRQVVESDYTDNTTELPVTVPAATFPALAPLRASASGCEARLAAASR